MKTAEAIHLELRWRTVPFLLLGAALCYWIAFSIRQGGAAILIALPLIFLLGRLKTARIAFYTGALCGLCIYVPQLWFFISVFHAAVIAIWCIAALPIGLFVLMLHQSRRYFGPQATMWIMPVVWTGIEFFRSELYYLKFAWILPGQVVAFSPGLRLLALGVYGLGFVYALAGALLVGPTIISRVTGAISLLLLALLIYLPTSYIPSVGPFTALSIHG